MLPDEFTVKDIEVSTGYSKQATELTQLQYNSWFAISLTSLLWGLFYQFLNYTLPGKSREYRCRIVSFSHGLITAFIGINQCFLIDNPFEHPEWRTTTSQKFLMVCSIGYFIHDLVWLLLYDRSSKVMLFHHIYSVFALYKMLFKDRSGAQATCSLGSMEISNPLLQIRWFLRSEGFYPSVLYTGAEVTFMIVFLLVRIVLGSYFLFVIIFQPKNDWDFKLMALSIYVISWIFTVNIAKYLLTKYDLIRRGTCLKEA